VAFNSLGNLALLRHTEATLDVGLVAKVVSCALVAEIPYAVVWPNGFLPDARGLRFSVEMVCHAGKVPVVSKFCSLVS